MLAFLALLLGPPAAAALVSLLGSPTSYFARLRVLSVVTGAVVLSGIAVVRVATDGPTTEGLLHLKHAVTLREGVEMTVPFELRRTNQSGHEVELHLDPSLPRDRWPPIDQLVSAMDGPPLTDFAADWAIRRDGRELTRREEPARARNGLGWTTDGPVIDLGRFHAEDPGTYQVWLGIERVPPALVGERANLVIDSDMIAYKTARGRAAIRNMAHTLLGASAAVTLLLGLLALWMRPRSTR